jgi:energy coupling factor transporter S component ThiW
LLLLSLLDKVVKSTVLNGLPNTWEIGEGVEVMPKTSRIALSAVLIALGVILSIPGIGTFPVGPTKVFPFQHMINVISGIFLGPWYATSIAVAIGIIRNEIGTGSIFAFPGGIPGAIVVSVTYWYIKKSDFAALTEPIGTAMGALISAVLVAPLIGAGSLPTFLGLTAQWQLFIIFFWMSSIPGAIIGYFLVVVLRRRHVFERIPL